MQRILIRVQISRRTQSNPTRASNYVYSVSLNSWLMGQQDLLIGACATIGGVVTADSIMVNEGTDVGMSLQGDPKKQDRKHPHIKSKSVFQFFPTAFHSTKQQFAMGRIHIRPLNICIYREQH